MAFSKKRVFFGVLCFCCLIVGGVAINQYFATRNAAMGREVWIDAEVVGPVTPVDVLGKAVRNDALSARFRIRWDEILGSGHVQGYLLYDRRHETLEYEDASQWPDSAGHSRYVFSNVTEDIVKSVAGSGISVGSLVMILPQHGCSKRKLG